VIEDLDLAAMKRSRGQRAYRRAVSDAAMGAIRPMLAYKTTRHGSTLIVADRWFASSQIHHGHTQPDGIGTRANPTGWYRPGRRSRIIRRRRSIRKTPPTRGRTRRG